MAIIGTQTTNEKQGGPNAIANTFVYDRPPKGWFPGADAQPAPILVQGTGGGGITIYTRP